MDETEKIFPVLLSGGAGVRLWPLSREDAPKQLIELTAGGTLFQRAAWRATDPRLFQPLTVIAGAAHRFLVAEQLRALGLSGATVALEPCGRNTTAAAAVAAVLVAQTAPDGLVLLMPADHLIDDVAAFQATVQGAAAAARRGFLTLFGIRPDSPATGYGYIRQGDAIPDAGKARRVAAFVEKPDRAKAETYLRSGDYFWNSGIVLARASVLLAELDNWQPEIADSARNAVQRGESSGDILRLDGDAYRRCPAISFDYAVLEKSDRVAVVPAAFGWRDVGSWSSLLEAADRDAAGNAAIGNVILEATKDSYVRSEGPLVATLGVEGLIVVATKAAILVAGKDHDQDIRTLVERLGKKDVDPA